MSCRYFIVFTVFIAFVFIFVFVFVFVSPVAISSVFKWVFYEPVSIGFRFRCSLVLRYSPDGNIINYLDCVNKLEQVKSIKIRQNIRSRILPEIVYIIWFIYLLKYNIEMPLRLLMILCIQFDIFEYYESLLILFFYVICCCLFILYFLWWFYIGSKF